MCTDFPHLRLSTHTHTERETNTSVICTEKKCRTRLTYDVTDENFMTTFIHNALKISSIPREMTVRARRILFATIKMLMSF